jgi:hypothetical protein
MISASPIFEILVRPWQVVTSDFYNESPVTRGRNEWPWIRVVTRGLVPYKVEIPAPT